MSSHFFAKFLGIYLLIIAIVWLTRKSAFEKGVRDVISSDGMFALTGAIHIIVGLVIVLLHSVWSLDWKGLITLIGYISIIQGIIRLIFPTQARRAILQSMDNGYWVWIAIAGTLGVMLTYNGFVS